MTKRSCQAHGLAPAGKLKDANIAVMRCRTGKYPDTFANVVPGLIGNHSPENASSRKNTMLTIGPAASAFGASVLTPTPSPVKLRHPTTAVRTKARMRDGK